MKTILFISLVTLANTFGDLLLSRGMKQVGEVNSLRFRDLAALLKRASTNLALYGGIGGMAVAFFTWLAVLSWADLSLAEPATSLTFVFNTIGAKFFLKEEIDRRRWIGTLCVCAGAFLLALTERHP